MEDLQGGDLSTNVRIVEDILEGQTGPKRDIVVLNAAYALYLTGQVKDVNSGDFIEVYGFTVRGYLVRSDDTVLPAPFSY